MKLNLNKKQPTAIVRILLISMGIILSCNVFAAKAFDIGDTGPGGGIVFHISDDGEHGLEAAQADQGAGIQWHNGSFTDTHAVKSRINDGSFNTDRIIINQGNGSYAALICANYNGGGLGDWYLPKDELDLMFNNLHLNGLGGFANVFYWSSTEGGSNNAGDQSFSNGVQNIVSKSSALRVRAVRAF